MTIVAILLLVFAALSILTINDPDTSNGLDALALICGVVLAIWVLVVYA